VLHIARKALSRLSPAGYTDTEDSSLSIRPEKVVAETGLLLLAASTVTDSDVEGLVGELASQLEPHARSERMLLGLALEPGAAWDYSQAHVFLTRLGYPDPEFDELLAASDSSQVTNGRERVPHRQLERAWLRRGLVLGSDGDHGNAPMDVEVLRNPTDLLTGGREDAYAFTHALMYLGDFAIRPTPWPRPANEICAEAEGILGRCLDQQDYDLSAEVLLAWPQTGMPWSAGATFGFRVLTAVEDRAGFLPSSTVKLERLRALRGEEHTDYLLAATYHTAYVMGLVCSMALQPGKAPPRDMPVGSATHGAADRLIPFLRPGDSPPHWIAEFKRLDGAERDALAPLLLSIALRRCVEAHQFASIRELLAIAQASGISDAPAASQAAELIGRLGTLTEVLDQRSHRG
jgi:hypothetical protein